MSSVIRGLKLACNAAAAAAAAAITASSNYSNINFESGSLITISFLGVTIE
ncbi:MAG: hypothetical protein GVX78_02800 [Bacteroidetes bacterium]|jgi:hypothetical protein|nr:hypothetical protein [Bacteroidota bacterium]